MQYTAVAVYLDDQGLALLVAPFSARSLEERDHAMNTVRYPLDSDLPVHIPGVDDVRDDFSSVEDVVRLALAQEKAVTAQISSPARPARDEGEEQVEGVASTSTLLTVVQRAGGNLSPIQDSGSRRRAPVPSTRGQPWACTASGCHFSQLARRDA
jgi:ferritin